LSCLAQQSTVPTTHSGKAAAIDQEQFLPYWTTETGWRSELQLRNNLASKKLTVTPALRTLDGRETALAPVTLMPREVQSIDLDAAIDSGSPQLVGAFGSVVLRYHSPLQHNLYAAMMVRHLGHSIAFHTDASGVIPSYESGSREGIWWLPDDSSTDYLVLSNYGNAPMALALNLFDASGKRSLKNVPLGPGETSRISVRTLVRESGLSGFYGGFRISTNAHAGALDALDIIFNPDTGFSALLKIFDHDPNTRMEERDYANTSQWTLRAPMLALTQPDPALAMPEGTTLQPQLFIRNTTGKPVVATLRFNWKGDNATGKGAGPSLQLLPFETRRIDVAALQDDKTLPKSAHWTSVTLTTNCKPDEILAIATSYDTNLRQGAQTPFTDQLSFAWEGGMWEYDAQHNSLITVGNGGLQPTRAGLTLFYNQGTQRYDLEQALEPDEQMWIDVGKLIREHIPDKNGKVLPIELSSGSYEFRDLNNNLDGSLFEGKLIYEKTYGHVVYGCMICCGYSPPSLLYSPLPIPLYLGAPNGVQSIDCNDNLTDVSTKFYGNWSTVNTGIATVDTRGYHTGVAVGSTSSTTFGSLMMDHGRTCYNTRENTGGSDNVNPPDHLKILSDSLQAISSCPATVRRLIRYQEVSVNNAPIGTIQSREQFGSKSANTCNNGNLGTSETCSADAGGVFTDILFVGCNSVGGSCGVTFTKQQWLWCPPNGAAVVIATPGDLIIHNNEVSVGGNTAGFATGTCIYASGTVSNPCI
jgi:hypothetical protein